MKLSGAPRAPGHPYRQPEVMKNSQPLTLHILQKINVFIFHKFNFFTATKEDMTGFEPLRDFEDVYKFQNELANFLQHNGGDYYFNWKIFDCTEQSEPHPVGTKTYLRLTTENFDIVQMDKSFITALLSFYVKLDTTLTGIKEKDTNKLLRIFVGLKNAAEFFGKLDTICNNVISKNTRSTWENVSNMNESVCGVYIPLADIADGQPHKVQMELTIPYQDLLKYQAFTLYPNRIVGELKEINGRLCMGTN